MCFPQTTALVVFYTPSFIDCHTSASPAANLMKMLLTGSGKRVADYWL
jgi:hypothetical protein